MFICLDNVESLVVVIGFGMLLYNDSFEIWNWGVLGLLLVGVWIIVRLWCIIEWSIFLLCIIGVVGCLGDCILWCGVYIFFFFWIIVVFFFDLVGVGLVMWEEFVLFVSGLCVFFFLLGLVVVMMLVIKVVN